MSFGFKKIKIWPEDTLYSKIIRHGHERCVKCLRARDLQCCHIIGRAHIATRWMLEPVRNAVPLCLTCHEWFDSKTSKDILFKEQLQDIPQPDNRWWWLVNHAGYSWQDLHHLHFKSQGQIMSKEIARSQAKEMLKRKAKELGVK